MIRLPLLPHEPLLEQLRLRELSLHDLNRLAGGRTTAHRLATKPMRWYVADKFAVALGMHPAEIWGEDWWAVAEAARLKRIEKGIRYEGRKPRETTDPQALRVIM